jgi:hypothetical protein
VVAQDGDLARPHRRGTAPADAHIGLHFDECLPRRATTFASMPVLDSAQIWYPFQDVYATVAFWIFQDVEFDGCDLHFYSLKNHKICKSQIC